MEEQNTASSEVSSVKVLIHNSDGYLIEVEEGTLQVEPPPPRPRRKLKRLARKDRTSRPAYDQRGKRNNFCLTAKEAPGFVEWTIARTVESRLLSSVKQGRPLGQTSGFTVKQATRIWKKAKKMAKEDMTEIKKKIDLSEAAEEALHNVLTVMRGPVSTKDQLAAASKVLEYTMAKPVAKSEVTVNAAEAWLASLKDDEIEE
jgi:hypothetical protein